MIDQLRCSFIRIDGDLASMLITLVDQPEQRRTAEFREFRYLIDLFQEIRGVSPAAAAALIFRSETIGSIASNEE